MVFPSSVHPGPDSAGATEAAAAPSWAVRYWCSLTHKPWVFNLFYQWGLDGEGLVLGSLPRWFSGVGEGAFGDFSFLPSQLPEQEPYYFNMSSKEIPLFTQSGSLRKREHTEQTPEVAWALPDLLRWTTCPWKHSHCASADSSFPQAPVTLLWHQGEAFLSRP